MAKKKASPVKNAPMPAAVHVIIALASVAASLSLCAVMFGFVTFRVRLPYLLIALLAGALYYAAVTLSSTGRGGTKKGFYTFAVLYATACCLLVVGVKITAVSLVSSEISSIYKKAGNSLASYTKERRCSGSEPLYLLLAQSQNAGVPASVALMPKEESFQHFLQKRWSPQETAAIGRLAATWEPVSAALAENMKGNLCLGFVNFRNGRAALTAARKRMEILGTLDEEMARMAVISKYKAVSGDPQKALWYANAMVKLLEQMRDDNSGFAVKQAAVSLSQRLNQLTGALQSCPINGGELAAFTNSYLESSSADLPGMGLIDETYAVTRLWSPYSAPVRTNPAIDALGTLTGASDISVYMLLREYRRFVKEGTKTYAFDFRGASSWPYAWAAALATDYLKTVKKERILHTEKYITRLGQKAAQYRRVHGRFPATPAMLAAQKDTAAVADAFDPAHELKSTFSGGIYTLYSIGIDRQDNGGDLKSLKDIGIMLY